MCTIEHVLGRNASFRSGRIARAATAANHGGGGRVRGGEAEEPTMSTIFTAVACSHSQVLFEAGESNKSAVTGLIWENEA